MNGLDYTRSDDGADIFKFTLVSKSVLRTIKPFFAKNFLFKYVKRLKIQDKKIAR